jgi:tripartite-type tricarboxylate transporter receptor subunit TctC
MFGTRIVRCVAWLAVWAAASSATSSLAQTWPAKPVRVVTEFVAGAGGDIAVRVIMAQLSAQLGQPVIIENHAGGSGVIAAQLVIRSSADGYSLLAVTPNAPVVRVHLAKGNQIDAQRTLTPVSALFETALVLVGHPSVPANSLTELVAFAKQNPGKLSYGTNGLGSSPHLAAEQLRMLTGAQLVHVPYKAMQQAMLDVATGQIPLAFALAGQIAPMVSAGKVKVIAMLTEKPFPAWPDAQTFRAALPGFEPVPTWTGLWAPAGLAQPALQKLSAELIKAMANPEVRTKLAPGGTFPLGNTPEEFGAMLRQQTDLVGRIVKSAGIEPTE